MKIEIRDLMSPKDEIGTRYFKVLPTISIVYRLGKYNVYLAWLNVCINIDLNN